MTVPQQTFPRLRTPAAPTVRPRTATLVPLLTVVLGRGLLLVCGVTLFVAVAASGGQVIDDAWQVLIGR